MSMMVTLFGTSATYSTIRVALMTTSLTVTVLSESDLGLLFWENEAEQEMKKITDAKKHPI